MAVASGKPLVAPTPTAPKRFPPLSTLGHRSPSNAAIEVTSDPFIAAGIDAFKGCEVHIHVQRQAVIRLAATHLEAQCRNLASINIDAAGRGITAADKPHSSNRATTAFSERHQLADIRFRAAQIIKNIGYPLARTV